MVSQCRLLGGHQQAGRHALVQVVWMCGDRIEARQGIVFSEQEDDVAAQLIILLIEQAQRMPLGQQMAKAAPTDTVTSEAAIFNAEQGGNIIKGGSAYHGCHWLGG